MVGYAAEKIRDLSKKLGIFGKKKRCVPSVVIVIETKRKIL
jgi:hypothetical protein